MSVDLSSYSSSAFDRGAGRFRESLWLLVSLFLFRLCPVSLSPLKRAILRGFGAKIGRGVVIKPQVKITFPWKLEIGDFVWLGEECWLLNLDRIAIGNNVCISQRTFLCTGNHNYRRSTFDLMVKPIIVEDGAWLGAGSWVGPGVKIGSHAILSACSMISSDMEPWGIYQGNPAVFIKRRTMENPPTVPLEKPLGVN
ncbi:MAG TPA: WcaF family extracellular polysaccharide biosynthesis acetyltransferase [Pseudomonadales bacterium]|nr:WcaF family extracellular polysaccharide biosynthesis acetyltransferase [Pseudomonadales bacterium]